MDIKIFKKDKLHVMCSLLLFIIVHYFSVQMSFDPHPLSLLQNNNNVILLQHFNDKLMCKDNTLLTF